MDTARMSHNFMMMPPGVEMGLNEWGGVAAAGADLPQRLPRVRGRDRSRHRNHGRGALRPRWTTWAPVINPLLMEGQLHGGIVQGVGQIVMENVAWDRESGQLVSGSFMDYTMPRADNLPSFEMEINEDAPTATNPMGIKGAGRSRAASAPCLP